MTKEDPDKHSWHDDTPFPRRWKGYVGIKIALLVIALMLALYLLGLL
jgi:hypothetical protein